MHIGDADSFSARHNFWEEEIPFSCIFLRLIPKKESQPLPYFGQVEEKNGCNGHGPKHMLQDQALAGGPDVSEKTEGKTPPAPARTTTGNPKPQCEGQEVNWSPAGLFCSVLNSLWADAGWEERVPLGCGSQTGLVAAAFAFPWPPHSRCCPS